MKLQERIIYIAYTIIYFIMGSISLSVAILFTKALLKTPFIMGIVMTPFMIAFYVAVIMIFVQVIGALLKVILSFADSKLLFDIQGKIYKVNDFIKKLPKYLNKIYMWAFICYWFLFIFVFALLLIKDKNYSSLLFLIPFIIAGIFMVKDTIKNK